MSAGSLPPLRAIVEDLPRGFPGAVVIAHHVGGPSLLPELIRIWSRHECRFVSDGEPLQRGIIYVAPAQQHVVINADGTLALSQRERVRFVRPSVDWLFESAAASFGARAIAVVLSGANGDGSHGVRYISRAGGKVMVQEPASCAYPEMSSAAIATGVPHRLLVPEEIGRVLGEELSRIQAEPVEDWRSFDESSAAASSLAIPA